MFDTTKDYEGTSVRAVWVIASHKGEQAKSVLAHAHAGVGSYIVLKNDGNRNSPECTVAFRYVPVDGIPHHLLEVRDPIKIDEYERIFKNRNS